MTTLATLPNLNEAFLLRSMLEASDIPAFIPDENTCQMDWGYINAIGGIRVQISEEHTEEAKSILARFKDNLKRDMPLVADQSCEPLEETQRGKADEDSFQPRNSSSGGLLLVVLAFGVLGVFIFTVHRSQEKSRALAEGNSASDRGDYDLAIADYNRAIHLSSKSATTYNARGIAYQGKGDYEKAIADYSMAIKLDPQEVAYYDNRGAVYVRKENYDGALADFNQATMLDSNDEPSWYSRGIILQHKGDIDAAIAAYSRALQIKPNDANVYVNRGIAYDNKGEFDKAISDYTWALQIDPQNVYANVNRGKAYGDKGENEKAMADYSHAIQLDPKDTQAYLNRGDGFADQHEYDEAIADFSAAIQVDPKYADAYLNRGGAHDNKGEYAQAIADYSMVTQLEPQNVAAYNCLAWDLATSSQANTRDGKKAVELATKACDLSGWKNSSILDTLAAAYAEAGDFENAIKWQRKCLELANSSQTAIADSKKRLNLYQAHRPFHVDK